MKNNIRDKIVWAFKNYQELKRIAVASIDDVAAVGLTANYSATGGSGGALNKGEERLLKAESKALNAWRWCAVVDRTYDHFRPDGKARLIELQYFQRLPKWQVAKKLHIAERTRFDWNEHIIITAMWWAQEVGYYE